MNNYFSTKDDLKCIKCNEELTITETDGDDSDDILDYCFHLDEDSPAVFIYCLKCKIFIVPCNNCSTTPNYCKTFLGKTFLDKFTLNPNDIYICKYMGISCINEIEMYDDPNFNERLPYLRINCSQEEYKEFINSQKDDECVYNFHKNVMTKYIDTFEFVGTDSIKINEYLYDIIFDYHGDKEQYYIDFNIYKFDPECVMNFKCNNCNKVYTHHYDRD